MGDERREVIDISCTHARFIYYRVCDVMWYCTVVT